MGKSSRTDTDRPELATYGRMGRVAGVQPEARTPMKPGQPITDKQRQKRAEAERHQEQEVAWWEFAGAMADEMFEVELERVRRERPLV